MASPDFLAACCVTNISNTILNEDEDLFVVGHVMIVVTVVMCVVSLLGVFYLLLPRGQPGTEWMRNSNRILTGPSLNSIIKCVIATNVLATLGLLIRSGVWLAKAFPSPHSDSVDAKHVFCIAITIWIEFFFLCNFFWHLIYAVEACLVSSNKELNLAVKYFLGWFMPAVLCIGGAAITYCNGIKTCLPRDTLRRDLNYLIFLFPVLLVLLCNPFFFYKSAKAAKKALIYHYGRYTSSERKLVDAIDLKFILIMMTFTACWLPNIINAIVRVTNPSLTQSAVYTTLVFMVRTCQRMSGGDRGYTGTGHNWLPNIINAIVRVTNPSLTQSAVYTTLVFMGLMNPLQAVFSTLVFWGIPREAVLWNRIFHLGEYSFLDPSDINMPTSPSQHASHSGSESDPLISFRHKERI